ncbi:hypothetical protein [Cesiribacter sp. SM1]|uniref:hypothetical protein n=1 Tax=Cesiribacter sp. SM1 TaxID=2861196 RepID=UPI001CD6E596|nr:hypothetical protein [Cesiribacter sp. SM1]
MNIRLIVLVLLLDLGLVLSVAYFHADAYPITQQNTATTEKSGAMRAAALDESANGIVSSGKGDLKAGEASGEAVWNQALFIKDLWIGLIAICVINSFLVLIIRKTSAAEVIE